jgi:serine protease AprX
LVTSNLKGVKMNKNMYRKVLTRFFVLCLLLTFGSLSWAQNHGPKSISDAYVAQVEEGAVKALGDGSGTLLAAGTGIDRGIGKAKDIPDLPVAATSKPAQPPGLADRDGDGLSDGLQAKLADALAADLVDVIVTFSGPGNAAFAQHTVGPFQVKREFRIIPGFASTMTAAQARALARAPGVFRVEEDFKVSTTLDAANRDFGIEAARTAFARTAFDSVTGSGVGIGVVDTGVDPNHEQLDEGKVVDFVDYVNNRTEPYDDHGHGTHVSSIATGDGVGGVNADTFKGVAPGASIYAAKVLDSSGYGNDSDVIAGVEWCADHEGVLIISMSLASLEPSDGLDSLSQAVNTAVDMGKVVVVAAGNSGAGLKTVGSPGAAAKAITVGAVAEWSAPPVAENHSEGVYLAPFSSRGPTLDERNKPDIVAPGVTITAARAGSTSGYVTYSGTSMATPFVSGTVALALQEDPSLIPDSVKEILMSTAQDRGPEGLDNDWGAGLIDGSAFVAEARGETGAEPTLFPKNERVSGTVADHREWTRSFDIAENELNMPIGVTMTIEVECGAEIFGVCLWWSPDLEAQLIDPNGTIIAESICPADVECGSMGRQETLHAMPTVAGTYTVTVYPCEDVLNNGIGGSFALDISTPLPAVNSNNPPVANGDGATVNENSSANSIYVLDNDSDPDGDSLTITGVTQGSNGAVVTNEQSYVTYMPKSDFYGSDSFTYSISDGNGGTDTATVAVTVTSTSADNSMHIGDLDGSSKSLKRNSWQADVTVTVHNATGEPVHGAIVTGHWSGRKIVNVSCVTDSNGQNTLTSEGISTRIDSVTFTVDDVTHPTLPLSYKASDNREPDDGDISNGTSITVSKP